MSMVAIIDKRQQLTLVKCWDTCMPHYSFANWKRCCLRVALVLSGMAVFLLLAKGRPSITVINDFRDFFFARMQILNFFFACSLLAFSQLSCHLAPFRCWILRGASWETDIACVLEWLEWWTTWIGLKCRQWQHWGLVSGLTGCWHSQCNQPFCVVALLSKSDCEKLLKLLRSDSRGACESRKKTLLECSLACSQHQIYDVERCCQRHQDSMWP